MAQVVKFLFSKCEALSSIPNTTPILNPPKSLSIIYEDTCPSKRWNLTFLHSKVGVASFQIKIWKWEIVPLEERIEIFYSLFTIAVIKYHSLGKL
jgi:hypothetical protein